MLDATEELFDLYPETYMVDDILPWLELAQALELVQESKDYHTGRPLLRLKMRDAPDYRTPMDLGASMDLVEQNADPEVVEEIKNQVQALLKTDYLRFEKRQQLQKIVFDKVRATADRVGAGSPRYKQELTAYKSISSILELVCGGVDPAQWSVGAV